MKIMKNTFITLFVLLTALSAYTQTTYTATFNSTDLSFDTIMAADSNIYTKVKLGYNPCYTTDLGKPELPMRTIRLIIPFGKAVSNINITNTQTQNFYVNYQVYPADSCGILEQIFVSPNTMIYASNNVYPVSPVMTWNQDYFDGSNIVSLGICPFEYYPSSNQLKLITSITISISYSDGNQNETVPLQRLLKTQSLYDSILYHLVDNPLDIANYQTHPTIVNKLGQTITELPVFEYVVVTPSVFAPYLHDFLKWKKQKGYHIGIVNIEDILLAYPYGDQIGTNPIEDAAGSLRQYLHDAYQLGTSYALLVGDPNATDNPTTDMTLMPCRYGCVGLNPPPDAYWLKMPTTDWYFSDLSGDWKVDTDTFYGEVIEDAPSCYANIMVGRLLCSSGQDISNWVNKLLLYERNPGNGHPEYLIKSLITLADGVGSSLYWENLPGFNHNIMSEEPNCFSPNPTFPKGSDIIEELNNTNYGLFTWFNHGGTNHQHSCMLSMTGNDNSSPSSFTTIWKLYSDSLCVDNTQGLQPDTHNSIDYMTNYDEPMILYAKSCDVIPFDHTRSNSLTGSRNCGESFTVGGLYGGVAFLGNTLDAFSGSYFIRFAETLNSVTNNVYLSHLGMLETNSKYASYTSEWREHYYKHNLLGDPECQIWTSVPNPLQFDYISQNSFIKEVSSSVEIQVSGFNNSNSMSICTITLYSENDVFKTMSVPISEQGVAVAVFDSIFPLSTAPISITATCYNHIPAQTYVAVTEECQLHITTDETWSGILTSNCDIIVHENATLTITGDLAMNVNNKIKVLPGGNLVLDGGIISCAVPGYQWQGVRVLGTGSGSWQGKINGLYSQGYVCLKNNAEINEARVAIDLWDGINRRSTGGIADVSDATFHNNGMAARALYFKNVIPTTSTESDYNAHFYNSSFMIDEDYPTEGVRFQNHISLIHVKGVILKGCDFSIQDCPSGMSIETNCAVFIHNGACKVDGYCSNNNVMPCPGVDYTKSYFRGFSIGINAINDGRYNSVLAVMNSVFLDNSIGIRTMNDINTTVLFTEFFIGTRGDCGVGIYLEKTPDFCIEENFFMKSNHASQGVNCFGIVADNTESSNIIYRNSFSNLTCANFAKGSNCNDLDEGLMYCCNDNSANNIDFFVPSLDSGLMIPNYGISTYQGSSSFSAGNTFSQRNVQWQFYNGSSDQISYYYDVSSPSKEPQDIYSFNLRKLLSNESNKCISNYGNSSGSVTPVIPPSERQQRENDYYNAYLNYQGLKRLYENCIDGGSTNEELNNILSATSENMWELRSELLGLSPYLSHPVLMAFVERADVFPQSVIFEVLASNPEELGRDSLLSFIECNSTLPDYMITVLNEVAKGNGSYRSILESQMSMNKHNYYKAAKDIVRSILNDTILDTENLRVWLGNLESISADRQIIASYLEEGNDSVAFALARMLPTLYGLTGDDLTEHNDYMVLLSLHDTLYRQGRTVYELTEKEISIIDSLTIYGIGVAQSFAKSITEARNGISEIDCPDLVYEEIGAGVRSGQIPFTDDMCNNSDIYITLSPNPANTWIEVKYTLPANYDYATLGFYSTLGNQIAEYELLGNSGQKVIDLRSMIPGVYSYALYFGKQKCTGKLVIVK